MDYRLPLAPDDAALPRRPRGPAPLWLLVAAIALVLATAALATALTPDGRDFSARHGSVLAARLP